MESLKRLGIAHMQAGRYGEAIDQFNKFIAANPQFAEGYNLRGLCYEKRAEYQYAVLDFRRAIALNPSNDEYRKNLNRTLTAWHKLLYQNIQGYKRDIAVDPKKPSPYLEIGKCYRWLEEWKEAEKWYDEYLKRDDNASPDEIIRYTEILAKTGSILKGEKILKKYVERFPDDWRLWSRYGYFTLWLGKYKIAEDAFKKALGFKPFFKEAQDGLDLVKNQGYLVMYQPRSFERLYPIDRYYAVLKNNPDQDEVRFKLVKELIKANRYEEAYQQLQRLQTKHSEEEQFKSLWQTVTSFRDSLFNSDINKYTSIIKESPSDKNAVLKLADAYGNMLYYDSALVVLSNFLRNIPDDQELDVRFKYAQYSAWNYQWENAISTLNSLLKYDPNNLEYQLLRGQIAAWTVQDMDLGEQYLLNVYNKMPHDIRAPLALTTIYSWKNDYEKAKKYLDVAKSIAPNSPEVITAESNYELHLSAYKELQTFEIRNQAGKLAAEGKCDEALAKYDEYKSQRTALTKDELLEYADINSCVKNYGKAIEIYDSLLSQEFDYDVALRRAKNYLWNGDSLQAVDELENLHKIQPDNMDTYLFLGDAYMAVKRYDEAEEVFQDLYKKVLENQKKKLMSQQQIKSEPEPVKIVREPETDLLTNLSDEEVKEMINQRLMFLGDAYMQKKKYAAADDLYEQALEQTKDTSTIRMLKQRIEWLPPYGFSASIHNIGRLFGYLLPTNIGISPLSNFYADNQKLKFHNYGLLFEGGFIGSLSLGASWIRTNIYSSINNKQFTAFSGRASLFLLKFFTVSGSYGLLNILGEPIKYIGDLTMRYEKQSDISSVSISGYYNNNDARLVLYSQNIVNFRSKIEMYRFNAAYELLKKFKVSGYYAYYKISDSNEGNDLLLRIGRQFLLNSFFGYEYYFSDYAFISPFYYSPQNFTSHSLWGEYQYVPEKNLKLLFGGKIGYVPSVDFVISEISAEISFNPFELLVINGKLSLSNSFRYDSNYKSFSASVSAYWSIF
ncbi:tetratricopeptide repeat protein [Melioribacteraceae bacterium 4301-Me]|uniref:tetratricopeptide repeat protein n=1 Tax=Pyranulibacter aquaticus TaxID=3163344 RepID=UPI003594E51E